MKIVTVVGARPQFIKAAVVSRALERHSKKIDEIIVHTGQHYDKNMSEIFFDELELPVPHINLAVGGGTHGENTGRMIERIERVILNEKPDLILVYGDTDSTLAAAVAASKVHIPVAHVEAGLRSRNRRMPEEINRILTDHVASILFAPTESAVNNLLKEGVEKERIYCSGDVMYDAALFYKERAKQPKALDTTKLKDSGFFLCTIHRAENTESKVRMSSILEGLGNSEKEIVLPLHPRTRIKIHQMGLTIPQNISVIEPVGYLEMIWLESNCFGIATDSGGVQKEAFFHGKSCITLRDETEWEELVDIGVNSLVGANSQLICGGLKSMRDVVDKPNVYGRGESGAIIADILVECVGDVNYY